MGSGLEPSNKQPLVQDMDINADDFGNLQTTKGNFNTNSNNLDIDLQHIVGEAETSEEVSPVPFDRRGTM